MSLFNKRIFLVSTPLNFWPNHERTCWLKWEIGIVTRSYLPCIFLLTILSRFKIQKQLFDNVQTSIIQINGTMWNLLTILMIVPEMAIFITNLYVSSQITWRQSVKNSSVSVYFSWVWLEPWLPSACFPRSWNTQVMPSSKMNSKKLSSECSVIPITMTS